MGNYKTSIINKSDNEKRNLTIQQAILNQIKEYLKRTLGTSIIYKAVYLFLDKNLAKPLTSVSVDKLVEKIHSIIKNDYNTLHIANMYPVTTYYLLDRIILEYTFTMFPPEEYGTTKEAWEGKEYDYIKYVIDKNNFDNSKMLATRNALADLLGMTEYEIKQNALMKMYGNKYNKILPYEEIPFSNPSMRGVMGGDGLGEFFEGAINTIKEYWYIPLIVLLAIGIMKMFD
ncbi:MAG: hypothetical protein AMQ22_01078 [Candidatus Methanofastidiosum methylothiophilum]|uniref:Uncharacterized protein n=1 Tax=Candidatus Methanofastidiosum methylothiophilum TaxID=1705564 RepID=A0A150J3Z0_9EURY|nr:MAG: hypothetical protein AMQ22_01078 [Candidatus Methanofastidiosum methylthiophilus]